MVAKAYSLMRITLRSSVNAMLSYNLTAPSFCVSTPSSIYPNFLAAAQSFTA